MLGGGAGHIADMISRYKSNMSMLTKRRYFKRFVNSHGKNKSEDFMVYTPANQDFLRKLKRQLIFEKKLQLFKRLVILLISILLTLWLINWLISQIN